LSPNEEVIVVSKFYCGFYHIYSKKKIPKISKLLRVSSYLLKKCFNKKKISKFSSDVEKLKLPSYKMKPILNMATLDLLIFLHNVRTCSIELIFSPKKKEKENALCTFLMKI
jgi:hypothetical protein